MLTNYLALDIGEVRIGAAVANSIARLAAPHTVIPHNSDVITALQQVIDKENIQVLVIGLPRNLNGESTPQTEYVETFIAKLQAALPVEIVVQDEALTSVKAESELKGRGKPFSKGDIDSLSAVYILEDFLVTTEGVH